jgi:serine protease Do
MKIKILLITLFLLITRLSFSQEGTSFFEENVRPVGLVYDSKTGVFASGFFVSSRIFITNFHVADGINPSTTKIKKKNEEVFTIKKILGKYSKCDLAIIETNEKSGDYFPLENPDKIKIGEKVFAIGNPGTAFDVYKFNLSEGIVNNIVEQDIPLEYFQVKALAVLHSATINTGNSGGPLINENGAVVGINSYYLTGKQNLNFAIHVKELIKILDENDLSYSKAGTDIFLFIIFVFCIILLIAAIIVSILIYIKKNRAHKPAAVFSPSNIPTIRAFLYYNNQGFEITQGGISIGRDESAGLRIFDDTISRNHCRVYFENGNYCISDLGSKNGTFVNDRKIIRETLNPGDTIKIGSSIIIFRLEK